MKHTIAITAFLLYAVTAVSPHITYPDSAYARTLLKPCRYTDLFEEITAIIEKNFYDPARISKDFPAIKSSYQAQIKHITDMKKFSQLINAMLGELRSSHTYYLTPDDYEYYHLGALFFNIPEIGAVFKGKEVLYPTVGVITQSIDNRTYVASVLHGSVAEKAGLLKGDEILAVNGKPYAPVASLRSSIGKNTAFSVKRNRNSGEFTIEMKPVLLNPKKEMLEAQRASIRVINHKGNKIGYIHIYSYAGEEYHKELQNAMVWGRLKDADALIIDLRYGLGGAWLSYLNIFNRNIPVMTMTDRGGKQTTVDSQWRKPAVYLINRYSRSGKELLVFGAKKYRLATVIGERTPGCTRGGRLFPLSNGDFLFLAVQRCRVDGNDLEGVGVVPDITVPFDIRYCNGRDIQLEKAIEYLSGKIDAGKNNR